MCVSLTHSAVHQKVTQRCKAPGVQYVFFLIQNTEGNDIDGCTFALNPGLCVCFRSTKVYLCILQMSRSWLTSLF